MKPSYQPIRCPKCGTSKVARAPTFYHCGKAWPTEKCLVDRPARGKKALSKPGAAENSLEFTS